MARSTVYHVDELKDIETSTQTTAQPERITTDLEALTNTLEPEPTIADDKSVESKQPKAPFDGSTEPAGYEGEVLTNDQILDKLEFEVGDAETVEVVNELEESCLPKLNDANTKIAKAICLSRRTELAS